jgi:hypothetical protein
MTWALIGWSVLVVIAGLALSAHASSQVSSQCMNSLYDVGGVCQQVAQQTGGQEFEHVLKIGVVGFAVLAAVWFMSRPRDVVADA